MEFFQEDGSSLFIEKKETLIAQWMSFSTGSCWGREEALRVSFEKSLKNAYLHGQILRFTQNQPIHRWLSLTPAAAKSLQSCPTLCDPIDGNPPGSIIPGILQARILEWVAISFSNAWKWKVQVKSLSCVRLLATPWTAAYQAPLSVDSPGKSTGVGCHCLLWWYNRCWQFDLWFLSLF